MQIRKALNKILPDKSLEKLALMVRSEDVNVRHNAVEALGHFYHEKALQIAKEALLDRSEEVVIQALRNLYTYCQIHNTKIDKILSITTLVNCLKTKNDKILRLTLHLVTHRYNLETSSLNAISYEEFIYSNRHES